ncbi:uncharacterized protein LOC112498105 [Citrus sinensis]|uniref:uncharacterized protein LOC112498105 n=1 Tax=Citrus sinensis TaxID=2711 RepID=UPI002279731D|nr:uncharacterized protein LOC112498105 [Citrus sinensis]
MEANVKLEDSPVANMTGEISFANNSLVVAELGMEVEAEILESPHGYKADNFIKRSGFDNSYRVEAEGFAGGIWVIWKDFLHIKIDASHSQVSNSRPFWFQAAWLTNEGFKDFVAESWNQNLQYVDVVNQFRLKVIEWNKQCFGNIFWRKKRLLARLGGIQRALESYYSRGLVDLEKNLKADLEENKILSEGLNSTLLALIPKTENPSSLKMYRPISLCNVAYKTITKMIANQLHSILPHLVGPHQTSFILGRHITENIVIAQEVMHSMRKKTGATGFMVIKVDLEKAYDRLSWEFISDTLREARIPPDLIQVIMTCITSATMRILWNGEATNEFIPSRGIRQGCPLSPYLFVLCIERLSHGIHNAVNVGKWRPIMLSHTGTPLSYLFFPDDLLLLAEATVEQAKVISAVLVDFCFCSNAKVNTSKTLLYFSKNIGAKDISSILNLLVFSVTSDLGKYLGVPLHHFRVSTNMFQEIIDKVEKRLSGWNASHLSLAGRITLAQSVLQAIPIYIMQTISLPSVVRGRIDRACRKFIWSDVSSQQKLSMSEVLASRRWCLGDGLYVRFWWDLWVIDNVPLIAYATDSIPVEILECKVADFVDVNGSWCWSSFEQYLPNNIILQIAALHPPSHAKGMDTIFWTHSKHGEFTTSFAYLALSGYNSAAEDRIWRLIWTWKGPQSVRVFLWQAFHARLKTKAELARRHLLTSTCCDRCGALCEDAMHALRDCPLVKQFWFNIIPISQRQGFFNARFHHWLHSNLVDDSRMGDVSNWVVFFGLALWRIWYWRN